MKILTNYDFSGNEIQNVKIQNLATPPSSPTKGFLYFNTTSNRLFVYDGSNWIGADASDSAMTGSAIVSAINLSDNIIDNDNLSPEVNDAVAKKHNTHSIATVSGLQTALDDKVSNDKVLTDVPVEALFTDTVTTVNGKTGAISKADIVALGIPAQDTTYGVFDTNKNGLAPKSDGATSKYLRADGTWVAPPDTKYTLPVGTSTVLGGVKSGGDITISTGGVVSITDNSHNHTITNVTGLQTALDAKETPSGATSKASTAENNAKSYTDTKIAELVGSAPETLDTLHELALALGEDPNFATTLTNQIALKANKYTTAIGDGSKTSFVITHNLNTRDVVVTLRESAAPYAQVITDVEMTTVNTMTVKFASAPTAGQYTITVIG